MSEANKNSVSKPRLSRKERARREFIRTIGLTAGVVGVASLGYYPVAAKETIRLRPPGALAEAEFLSSCIKCGQCVQVCPVEAIKLADIMDGFGVGAPYIDARPQACDFSCDGLQCVLACPTGSLTHDINYPHETRMGFAKLARPEKCLAMQGKGFKGLARGTDFEGVLRYDEIDRWIAQPVSEHEYDLELCDLCMRQCPIEIRRLQCDAGKPPSGDKNQCPPKRAIELVSINSETGAVAMKPEVLEGCVGCGVCEMICPTDPPAIIIEARATGVSV
ncbi:MAG: 4Fe-4S binding protein [Gammaproteobacteria bacterium]|nr:4Fe-4S binding protein [Gammaproteobacteria bacterium]MCW8910284.1 4Fe-4S binding protein [Gammaproteobacteria bacterium]MCW9005183.1 4Fe-4S binding protein [Gammaproteobacteria bacterium]